ncbi:MAG: LysR family transcriptional regulator [Sphingomonadales bacterium]|nr:LysR family transcriptional regulator [Sphingomonadales bacterium]MDE2171423.1 LysR family transcriptional regulator [Sphingomonadales bacterium]
MSLQLLRTFIEVYRQRSISGAARSLDLTQPAVSQQIAGLEGSIGRPLFERDARGVRPTPAADDLAADIGDRLDLAEAALSAARARSTEMAGSIQIVGHADVLAEVVAPQLIPLLRDGIRVRLQTGDHDVVMRQLVEGHCDLGISAFPIEERRLRSEVIRDEPVLAVAAPAVAARLNAVTQGGGDLAVALASEPVLTYTAERPVVDGWLERNQLTRGPLNPALSGQDLRALRHLLTEGFGWSVLPLYLCQGEIERGQLVEIHAPLGLTTYTYHLIWTPSALRQPRVAHARQILLQGLLEAGRETLPHG